MKVKAGGNAANVMTCTARLGLESWIVCKIGDDSTGQTILESFHAENVNTSHVVQKKGE